MPIDISKVKVCIDRDLREFRTIQDVAKRVSISPETLRKEFLRQERIALSVYLLQVRVRKMKEMLECTDKKCFEICFELGLRREDSAAKMFKRIVGMTMEQYRRQSTEGGAEVQPRSATRRSNRY